MARDRNPEHWDGPPLESWRPWTPSEAATRLAGVGVPWCVVGGWAIDCWLGRTTRDHDDLEIAIIRADFAALRDHLAPFRFHAVGGGEVRALPRGAGPEALPPPDKHQSWVLDEAADAWRMDVMLEPGDAETWVFRRDEGVTAPRGEMTGTRDGVPYLVPAAVLLYKAKLLRPKDQADFETCLPALAPKDCAWLLAALQRVHPGHPWGARLAGVND